MDGQQREGTRLPATMQDMLRIVPEVRKPAMAAVEQSPLLRQMEAFLPQLAAANAALTDQPVLGSCVDVTTGQDCATSDSSSEGSRESPGPEDPADRETECGAREGRSDPRAVEMDLYVDGSLGELVQRTEDAAPRAPGIELITPPTTTVERPT